MSDMPNPLQAFQSGFGIGSAILTQQQNEEDRVAKQKAAEAEAARQASLVDAIKRATRPGATYEERMATSVLLPKDQSEAMQKYAEGLSKAEQQAALVDTSKMFAAFVSGNTDIGISLLQAEADAQRANKNEQGAKFAESLIKVAQDPEGAKAVEQMLFHQMAALPGGKDAFDSITKMNADRRTAEEQPNKMAVLEVALSKAKTDEEKNQILLDFVKQRETSEIELIDAQAAKAWADAFRTKNPLKGSNPQADKLINDAVDNVGPATELAAQANNLANAIDKVKPAGGWPKGLIGKGWESLKEAAGGEDAVTLLKQEYLRMRNTDALKHLPPGAASDKDVDIALGAFPKENASPEYVASYMRGYAKLQAYAAEYNKAKAEWVDHVGSLGSANEDFTAAGINVKKGQNFWDLTKSIPIPNIAQWNKTEVKPGGQKVVTGAD